jgi:hypothetical protein
MARQPAEADGRSQPRGLINGWIGEQIEDREELGNPLSKPKVLILKSSSLY